MTTHTDSERVQTLAVLEANAGNVSLTSRETGVPRATVQLWRDSALAAAPELAGSLAPAGTVKTDWPELFGEALREGVAILRRKLPDASPRDAAISVGILSDKLLDHRDGRKSAQVNVDARSVHLTQLTDEELAKLNGEA